MTSLLRGGRIAVQRAFWTTFDVLRLRRTRLRCEECGARHWNHRDAVHPTCWDCFAAYINPPKEG